MLNISALVEYDGTEYFGFQRQRACVPTIQGVLEDRLSRLAQAPIKVIGASRTDAGVHARGQVINFKVAWRLPIERAAIAINSILPKDIAVRNIKIAHIDFHARFDAISKTYTYTILNSRYRQPLLARYTLFLSNRLDISAMEESAKYLIGEHNFYSFSIADKEDRSHLRQLYELKVVRRGKLVVITMTANSFLRGMARKIAAALIEVGLGKLQIDGIKKLLEAKSRKLTPPGAPPQGLCLMKVNY